jgi:YbgC/YbaW family acyl-CoA thioester hydrolase
MNRTIKTDNFETGKYKISGIFKMTYEYRLEVRGYELDSFNHVNNAVYLNYFEQARWDILNKSDYLEKLVQKGLFLIVTETFIRYHKEARLFDRLIIKTKIKKEEPYLVFYQSIYNEDSGIKLTKAEIKTLLVDKERIPYDIPYNFLNIDDRDGDAL